MKYFAFCDPSGGSSDSMTLAVARTSMVGTRAVLVGVWEKKPPFNPDAVTAEFAEILKSYRLTTVTGDRYSAEWVVARFRAHGIAYVTSEKTKSEIFLEFLALVNSDRVRIPNNKRLRAQFVSLERRTSRSGKDSVDHAPGGHDDLSNAVAGACVLAAAAPFKRKFFQPEVWTIPVGSSLSGQRSLPPPFVDPQAGKNLADPFLELPGDKWIKIN